MTELARPWERNAKSEVIEEAIAEQTHAPWLPKAKRPPKRIIQAAKDKRDRQQRVAAPPESVFKRQEFAKYYLIDMSHKNAVIRMGGDPETASQVGRRMLEDPNTLAAIQAFSSRLETDKIVSRERVILGLLEEANHHGLGASHSARVAAWSRLAVMLGADKPKADEDPSKKHRGGVMIVPFTANVEAWEQAATGQQALLKAAVRE